MSEFRIFCFGALVARTLLSIVIFVGGNPNHYGLIERESSLLGAVIFGGIASVAIWGKKA